jgi:HlyD family secretion protein
MKQLRNFSPLFLFLLACAAGCNRAATANQEDAAKSGGPALERVVVGKAAKKSLRLETTQPGRIEAFEETPLHSKLAGYVDRVLVDIGDHVKKDQPLVSLWVPELALEVRQKESLVRQSQAAIEQAKATLRATEAAAATKASQVTEAEAGLSRASAQLERWTAELARMTQLAENDSVTQRLVDETRNQFQSATAAREETAAKIKSAQAELVHSQALAARAAADVAAAEAQLAVARANLDLAQALLQYAEIKAPFDGVVTARNVDTRHFVQPGTGANSMPLIVVAQSDKLRVTVDVPEMEAGMLSAGDKAVVRVQSLGNREFTAPVTRDAWSLNASNRSLRAEVDLPNIEGALRPGMYASVTISLAETPESLVLPATAVLRDATGAYCMIVNEGIVHKRPLETGLRSGPEIEIKSGVSQEETIILVRGDSFAEGQKVEVLPAK